MSLITNDNKRIRPAIGDLNDYGKRYKGKKISRNEIDILEENDESDDINLHLSDDEDTDDEDLNEEEDNIDEDDNDEEEEEDDDNEEDDEDEIEDKKPKSKKANSDQDDLNILNNNQKEEVEKGLAVKNQLGS